MSGCPAFRQAFHGFDPDRVAAFDDTDIERLLLTGGIVRNRRKIEAAITNARATIALRQDEGLPTVVWSFMPEATPQPRTMAEVPTVSGHSTTARQATPAGQGRRPASTDRS